MEGFSSLGVAAWVMCILYLSLPGEIKKLKYRTKILEKKMKGGNPMSTMLKELEGKQCTLVLDEGTGFNSEKKNCTILTVGDDWVKYTYRDKKEHEYMELIRVDSVVKIKDLSLK